MSRAVEGAEPSKAPSQESLVAMEEAAWSGIAMVALGCHGCPAEAGLWPLCCFHTPPSNPSVGLAFRAMISEPDAKHAAGPELATRCRTCFLFSMHPAAAATAL